MFLRKKYDVVFYYPQHFNRGTNGTNPFFDPLLKACEKHGISYLLIEEPDHATPFPGNSKAVKFDFWFYMVVALRKFLSPISRDKNRLEETIGKIVSLLSMNRFKAGSYITISNSMIGVLLGLNKNARVFDLQHGIIYSWHWGYFMKNGILNKNLGNERIHFLVNGEGYKEQFYKNNNFPDREGLPKAIVIGSPIQMKVPEKNTQDCVVYTLHITDELNPCQRLEEKSKLLQFLSAIQPAFSSNGITLLLKHHPRFNGAVDFSGLEEDFPFAKFTTDSIQDLAGYVFLHITQASTSAFEFALQKIPTFIIPSDAGSRIFSEAYRYPVGGFSMEDLITMYRAKDPEYDAYCETVKNWAQHYYQPFDEEKFISLLRNG